jgi:LCP family protein required for cell wall assembly
MSKFLKSLFLLCLVFIVIVLLGILVTFQKISKAMGKPSDYLLNNLTSIGKNNPYLDKEKINFIVLGLDKRDDLLEKTNTTDTIIFVSLNLKNQKINTISIPRDLWLYSINSKVNEIYPLSLTQPSQLDFIKDQFNKLINQSIDHVVVLSTDNLIKFVTLIGGVDVTLENGFIDTQYPNPEYIKNPSSNIPKYKTIEFKSGLTHLDSTNITEFVRSRKGSETISGGGTDLARIQRQQLLIEAILNKVKTGEFVNSNPNPIDLYLFWDKEITKDISDREILQLLTIIASNFSKLILNKIEIPIGTNSKNGVIYHPTYFYQKQWVFIPSDKEYKSFQQFFFDSI